MFVGFLLLSGLVLAGVGQFFFYVVGVGVISALSGTELSEGLEVDGTCDVRLGVIVFVGSTNLLGVGF